jgi:hypothetical protein
MRRGESLLIDVHAFVGAYPFRHLPHPEPEVLVRVMDREGVDQAWVGYLPSALHRDPSAGNRVLAGLLAPYSDRLRATPAIRPDWPGWPGELARAVDAGAVAIRAYPAQWGLAAGHSVLGELASACGARGVPMILTVRFEDSRQRHPMDVTPDLSAAHVRELARAHTGASLIVNGAGRALIEEVHWGLTPAEQGTVWWDISWIWGPPEDDLAHLIDTIGGDRFLYGSAWPLRLAQTPRANLALLPGELLESVPMRPPGAVE